MGEVAKKPRRQVKREDAPKIFRCAEAYARAAEALAEDLKQAVKGSTNKPEDILPLAVLDAFAVELYLKCLRVTDYGNHRRGHDLKELVEALKPETQQSIRVMYNHELASKEGRAYARMKPRSPIGFDRCLEMSKHVFEDSRYPFEMSDGKVEYWTLLRKAVRRVICASYPQWM